MVSSVCSAEVLSVLATMSCRTRTSHDNQLFFSSFSLFFLFLMVPALGLNLDGSLLLSFKYSILSDPLSVLDNWDYNDITPCLWTGVTCAQVETSTGAPDMFRVISVVLPNSKLHGTIPEDLGFIKHLQTLDLSNNFLNGTLPLSIFNASELEVLSLSFNSISGGLREFAGGRNSLKVLNLSENALAGKIPKNLTSLKNLTVVSLRSNYFSGLIPGGVQNIEVLDFSSNLFNGSLPVKFGGENLRYLNLSSNKLSGLIPSDFAKNIPANATIDLSFNSLKGEIPESMALINQKTGSYAGNTDLCGKPLKKLCTIPSTLTKPPHVSTNTSNPAIAAIPRTIGSTPLPNSPGTTSNAAQDPQQHGLKPGAIAGIAVGDLAGIGVLAIVFFYLFQLKKKKKKSDSTDKETPVVSVPQFKKNPEPPVEKEARNISTWLCLSIQNGEETSEATGSDSDDYNGRHSHAIDYQVDNEEQQTEKNKNQRSLVMVDGMTELELETLLKASAYILGSSSASIVYKAVLQDGTSFAVRRIGESGVEKLKEFENQVKIIAKLRHPNLVPVRGFYWGDVEKLVIYDYVSNGSLANVGFRKAGSSPHRLPFGVRLKIAKGVARGLTYIHEKKHVHGNIKPSNILLTAEMEPLISDLGLHWLIYGKHSHKSDSSVMHYGSKGSTSSHDNVHDHPSVNGSSVGFVRSTSPYHAPESLKNLKPNPKWDVYSFGILLLELITGKVFSDRELSQWTTDSIVHDPNRVLRMADVAIRADIAIREEVALSWFKLGFSSASLIPQKRPSMKDALLVLEKMR